MWGGGTGSLVALASVRGREGKWRWVQGGKMVLDPTRGHKGDEGIQGDSAGSRAAL